MALFQYPTREQLKAIGAAAGVYYSQHSGIKQNLAYKRGGSANMIVSRKRKSTMGSISSFRKQMLKNTPANHLIYGEGTNSTTMLHNNIYLVSPTQGIIQGTSIAERQGDEVNLEALKVRGLILTATPANWYSYRIIVGYSGEEWNVPTAFSSALLGTGEIFLTPSGQTYGSLAQVNPKSFTVLDDRNFTSNSTIDGVREVIQYDYNVPLHSKFPYQSNASQYGKLRNLYVVVIGSVGGGTAGTTDCGNVYCGLDLIFKNP